MPRSDLASEKQNPQDLSTLYSSDIEGIRSKSSERISQVPLPPDPFVLGLILKVEWPALVHVPITIRGPEHTFILLAKRTVLTAHDLVVDILPTFRERFTCLALVMEAVERLADCRVSPAVGCAVVAIGIELRVFPAIALDLNGEKAILP